LAFPGPAFSKFRQANPNETKQNGLDRLGIIRANLDFSIGYSESKSKKPGLVSNVGFPSRRLDWR
jgi:hypothetical protein